MEMMQLEPARESAYRGDKAACCHPQPNAVQRRAVPRVLVVDRDADTADTLAMLFEMFGCQVRATYDWKDVESLATLFQPDLMIVDLGHPQACVPDAIRRIRDAAGTQTVRIAAHSAWTHEKARFWAWEVGCDEYLVKPVEASVLRRLLEELPMAEPDTGAAFNDFGLGMTVAKDGKKSDIQIKEVNQFAAEMDHYSKCVLENKEPRTPSEEGLADIRVTDAITETAQIGKVVAVAR
jgi:CheY-like chemotaxis protein